MLLLFIIAEKKETERELVLALRGINLGKVFYNPVKM